MKYQTRITGHLVGCVAVAVVLATGTAKAQDWQDAAGEEQPASSEAAAETPLPPGEPVPSVAGKPQQAPTSAPPTIDVTTPEPEPAVARTYHVHDGFYLRLNLGIGAYAVRYDNDVTAAAGALAIDALVGGSPSPGFAIGGGLIADHAQNAQVERDGREVGEATVETGLIGVFIDGFPDPKGGFHVGGLLGLANIRTDAKGADVRNDTGAGAAVWVGYDAWVAEEWSVGGLLRFSAALGRSTENDQDRDSQSRALTLMFTALYH